MAWGNEGPAIRASARAKEEELTGDMFFAPELAVQLGNLIPKRLYYIFNIGPLEHVVHKGSGGPIGGYRIKACEKGKPYSEPLILPGIVTDTYMVENMIRTHSVTGEFMCRDIVHPFIAHSIGGREAGWSIGQNLDDFGVFYTDCNPPSQRDLDIAREKMERTFRAALAEANMLEAQNHLDQITPLMRHAARHFGEDRDWNKIYQKHAECPACGGQMKEGVAVHSCGAVLNWVKAIALNARNFEDAKKSGVYTELLEKQVAEMRAKLLGPALAPLKPANPGDGTSFATLSELEALEREEGKIPDEVKDPENANPARTGPKRGPKRPSRGGEQTRGKS